MKLDRKLQEILKKWNTPATTQKFFFILNALHQIQSSGYLYCYCNEEKKLKCQLCVIPTTFFEFLKDIEKNMFNLDFLHSYYPKLCFQLNQLFDEDKTAAECFLHSEYEFRGRD